eukprot:TRINITY_DN4908_c0_g3_i1.p1 TRINITY_DN4908_c0_g3~~TRINITY_DN4908_c0_g3_i1.p1  ORF type:complete len:437 (+),score=79.81 TRINITY_DN4908_c0_g3_i1:26-1312(+)
MALAQSNSSPTLPPLSPSRSPPPGALAAHSRAAQRGVSEASKRTAFLSGLINQDLQKLTSWHGTRPPHEQKRFLRSIDSLYKAYDAASGGVEAKPKPKITEAEKAAAAVAAQEAAFASAAAMQRAAEEDPLKGPPRSPRALGHSASEPGLVPAQPIEVFEQKKKQSFRKNRDPTAEDPNNLMDWLEGQSLTSQTTATTAQSRQTRFSDLTMTSLGGSSMCSEPGTMHQTHFRAHKRAYAANKKCFVSVNQHEDGYLKGGVPNSNWPDSERLQTTFKDQFGSRPKGQNISQKMYENVLQNDKHEFVSRFLETAPPEQKEQFSGMVRSLQYLRQKEKKEKSSAATLDWDLEENARLWRPPRQEPVFDTSEINLSRIPLGSMQQTTKKAPPPPSGPPPQHQPPPPSPSVSGLGSLPLTRLSTPQVLSEAGY